MSLIAAAARLGALPIPPYQPAEDPKVMASYTYPSYGLDSPIGSSVRVGDLRQRSPKCYKARPDKHRAAVAPEHAPSADEWPRRGNR
jgi:hypothetical protein